MSEDFSKSPRAPWRDCTCYINEKGITPESLARCPRHGPQKDFSKSPWEEVDRWAAKNGLPKHYREMPHKQWGKYLRRK